MNRSGREVLLMLCTLLTAFAGRPGAAAQLPPEPPTNPRVNLPSSLLLPPGGKSPVETFRELLAMSPAERKQYLTNRPPESQRQILSKVREYESMKPTLRELRLKVTELRWYLLPLMQSPPAARTPFLQRVPADLLPLVENRLQDWDKLAPEIQKELLENEATVRYFTELETGAGTNNISPARQQMLQRGIAHWQSMPDAQRQKITQRFKQFFELTPQEQDKALSTLSEAERRQIEKTLNAYGKLNPVQRAACIRSFVRFASLPIQERQQFLRNAERWKLMTPDERQDWKDLVNKLSNQPPMPPEVETASGLPPMPPRLPAPRLPPRAPLATNHN
jgi:hypothetical protein